MSNRAAFIDSAQGPIVVRDTEIPTPGGGEILIKVQATAVQPVDAKVARAAMFPSFSYPAVLGTYTAGIVEKLGPGTVGKFKVGDHVGCGTKIFLGKHPKYGGLQRYAVFDELESIHIGTTPFPTAVALGSSTPPGTLFAPSALSLHRPTIPPTPLPAPESGKKILIWGGSSAMGALSISYAKLAGYTVISTSSPRNFALLRGLGADHVFDHSAPDTVERIGELGPVDYFLDTVSLPESVGRVVQLVPRPREGRTKVMVLLPLAMLQGVEVPDYVELVFYHLSWQAPENREWAEWLMGRGGFLERALEAGVLKGVDAEVMGGLEKAGEAIDRIHKGVSGKKIVIEPWA
ncbi:GroES-like protein [Corynespora cassiicola Philippines]|uniref:GroES-like protein n=1 Tax=Corynespora cassiicola Philippines TaxID=1448308 RepID=A0A2T2P2F4_CORCC|nr:GroES-like protein [Corynespora cassiicola Philippines]